VPLTASGNLTIVTSSDLGPLGPRKGLPVSYDWTLSSLAPLLVPWLVVLGLLALKRNRCAAAWWIWLPAGCLAALPQAPLEILPPGTNFFLDVIAALAAGLAAVWLLSDFLRRRHAFISFLCVLLALAGFSALAFVSQQSGSLTPETLQAGIVLAMGVLVSSAALSLGGLVCRRRYRPAGIYVWLFVWLAVIWLAIAAPFVLVIRASGGAIGWNEFIVFVLAVAMGHFAMLLPFLILSSASPFFRERFKALLHAKAETPPFIAPLPDAFLKA